MGSEIVDIDFHGGDVPVALFGNQVVAYSQAFQVTGTVQLTLSASELVVFGDTVFTFRVSEQDPHQVIASEIPLFSLNPATPGAAIIAVGLPFEPEAILRRADNTVLLFDRELRSLFQWDPASRS